MHHFQINLRGIIELLADHLYSRPEVFVRELLQNGVDAITARTKLDPNHRGELTFEVSTPRPHPGPLPKGEGVKRAATLVVTDNGIGMTEAEIHKFLATIGESSKRDPEGKKIHDYLGQFGIGLLSCFVVSDEIVVVTKTAREDSPAVEWRGRADGTYAIRTLNGDFAPGTQVFLTCRAGNEELFTTDRMQELTSYYGGLLPYPITITRGSASFVVNREPPPWRRSFHNERERTEALLRYGREVFGQSFLDAVPLRSQAGHVEGVAFVLPNAPSLAAKGKHRVYLKNMLLSEEADNLLPNWAFFIKAIVNVEGLRPTASRESFYEDERLEATREELGGCLRDYLIHLAERDTTRLQRFLDVHHLAIKALAVEDDQCYQTFIDWLPFETSQGRKPVRELRESGETIRFVDEVSEFHQIAKVAAAQGITLVNAGYVYEADLLARLPEFFPDANVERLDASTLAQDFEELSLDEQDRVQELLNLAARVLRPWHCQAEARKFRPTEVAALFSASADARFHRSLEQAKETADPLFAGVLGALGSRRASVPQAQLCLNYSNTLIQQLARLGNSEAARRSIEILYVQALLLAQQPLTTKELGLLTSGMAGLIEWAAERGEKTS